MDIQALAMEIPSLGWQSVAINNQMDNDWHRDREMEFWDVLLMLQAWLVYRVHLILENNPFSSLKSSCQGAGSVFIITNCNQILSSVSSSF